MAIYFQILWNRLYIVLIVTAIATGVAAFATLQMEPIYTTRATLLIIPFGLGNPDVATVRYSEQLATTFSLILDSEVVSLEAEQRLGREGIAHYEIGLLPNSELLQINATDTIPERAQRTANVMAEILVERIQSQYGTNLENIEGTLGTLLVDLETEIQDLILEKARLLNAVPVDNVRIDEIERTLNSREDTYNTLLASYNQTLIDQTTQNNLISVFEEAVLPVEPSGPSLILNTVAGMLAGGIGGIALVFVLELLYPRAYTDRQLEDVLGADIIGRIPVIRPELQKNVFAGDGALDSFTTASSSKISADGIASESFRRLRTKIDEALIFEDNKSVLMLSAKPGVGKSIIAVNLAIAMARSFKRVLLIDGDMNNPSIHMIMGLPNKDGLTQVLVEATSLQNAVHETDQPYLHVLTSGTRTSLSAELLGSLQMRNLVQRLTREYDCVIIDGAPLLAVTDPSVVASYVGGSIFVVRNKAELQYLKQSRIELAKANAKLLGVVINRVTSDVTFQWTSRYYRHLKNL